MKKAGGYGAGIIPNETKTLNDIIKKKKIHEKTNAIGKPVRIPID